MAIRPRNLKAKGWEIQIYDNVVFIQNPKRNLSYQVNILNEMVGCNHTKTGLFSTNVLTGITRDIREENRKRRALKLEN